MLHRQQRPPGRERERERIAQPKAYDLFSPPEVQDWLSAIQDKIKKGLNPQASPPPSRSPSPLRNDQLDVAQSGPSTLADATGQPNGEVDIGHDVLMEGGDEVDADSSDDLFPSEEAVEVANRDEEDRYEPEAPYELAADDAFDESADGDHEEDEYEAEEGDHDEDEDEAKQGDQIRLGVNGHDAEEEEEYEDEYEEEEEEEEEEEAGADVEYSDDSEVQYVGDTDSERESEAESEQEEVGYEDEDQGEDEDELEPESEAYQAEPIYPSLPQTSALPLQSTFDASPGRQERIPTPPIDPALLMGLAQQVHQGLQDTGAGSQTYDVHSEPGGDIYDAGQGAVDDETALEVAPPTDAFAAGECYDMIVFMPSKGATVLTLTGYDYASQYAGMVEIPTEDSIMADVDAASFVPVAPDYSQYPAAVVAQLS